ncbi:universal stress protein [Kitasatospora sp. SUK 42]|uniref:universal stress protein n=1 Tax=Kitasatospora sp. SUK 42 TaxID=1588882 RepID=UPI0027E2FF77|nr:universal stress protein [Kitasatospora sp. SUK 42]
MTGPVAAGPVVVGFDGSPESLAATEWAAREAQRRGVHLDVVEAWPWPKRDVVGSEQVYERAMSQLAEREAGLRALLPDLSISSSVVSDDPAEALEAAGRDAGLLVLGSRGLGALRGFLTGSVSQAVLRRAPSPVVLVRAEGGESDGPVMVGLDVAHPVEDLLAFAFEAAALRSAPLRVVHVWSPPAGSEYMAFDAIGGLEKEVSAVERTELDEALEPWRARHPEVEVSTDLIRGKAAVTLVDAAATARLLVVGRRARRLPLLHHHLGSVAHAVIHHVHCPVAVIPFG